MGLDIGYRVWKKQANGKLTEVKIENDSNWISSCYNCRVAASWFDNRYVDKGEEDFCSEGVFDEDYDGAIVPSEEGDYATKLFYLPFKEFKDNVMDEVKSVEDDMTDTIHNAIRSIIKAKDRIKEYQELQLRSQSELVFDKYQALIDEQNSNLIKNGRITCVISSNPNAYALVRAKENNIDTDVIKRKDFDSFDEYDSALTDLIKSKNADLVVLAGFMTILGHKVISAYENKIINIHPALIPSFCGEGYYGLHVHEAALKKGVKLSGATVHFVNEECDGGPIIMQKAVEVHSGDTPEILQKRIMEQAEWKILPKAVSLFCEDKIEVKNNIAIIKQ